MLNDSPKVIQFVVDESTKTQQKAQIIYTTLLKWRLTGIRSEGYWGKCEEMGAGEIAERVKYLLHKQDDLCSGPQKPDKSQV